MLIPEPQEDELDLGLLGRITQLNDFNSPKSTVLALQHRFKDHLVSMPIRPRLLALATHMSDGNFIKRHTMAPFYFAFSKITDTTHVDQSKQYLANWYRVRQVITAAYFCPSCAQQDVLALGFSYWRRIHHITGLDYCTTHNRPLSVTSKQHPYTNMPHIFLGPNELNNAVPLQDVTKHAVIRRYGVLCSQLLASNVPLDLWAVQRRISDWVIRTGLYAGNNRGPKRPTITDIASQVLPSAWLSGIFPSVYAKIGRGYVDALSRTVRCSETAPASHYSLTMALISSQNEIDFAKMAPLDFI